MPGAVSYKKCLIKHNQQQYAAFLLNGDEAPLSLPIISSVPWVSLSGGDDVFNKKTSLLSDDHCLHFISKNKKPHSFVWKTDRKHLKEAVRWGIIRPESITGQVVSILGRYRIAAHERVVKGMVSNTQGLKLKLLDHYQDRIEALQAMESLVNTNNTQEDYRRVISNYIEKLNSIKEKVTTQLMEVGALIGHAIPQIKADIDHDIQSATAYLHSLKGKASLHPMNRARGHESILEFVKQQMMRNVYELQGINQDFTYTKKRFFALTRGELNDFIEEARNAIDEHNADPRNAIMDAHHGNFGSNEAASVSYDFSKDHLSAKEERQRLLGISFIEGMDRVNHDPSNPTLCNDKGCESLRVITATRWQLYRTPQDFFKSFGHYILNIIKGLFVETLPWTGESWLNTGFRPHAHILQESAKRHIPLWIKGVEFLKLAVQAGIDALYGARNYGVAQVDFIPAAIANDWASSKKLAPLVEIITQAKREIRGIAAEEGRFFERILTLCGDKNKFSPPVSEWAKTDYPLTPGEQNDILTAMSRGINAFSGVFTETFAKNPIAGILFTATYAVGGAVILAPSFSAHLFGHAYVNWFTKIAYSMGPSKMTALVAGGSGQGQILASTSELLIHGPSSTPARWLANAEDPLAVAACVGAAYGLGWFLANGLLGHPIPWLSQSLRDEMGSMPEPSYFFLGLKAGFSAYELFSPGHLEAYHPAKWTDPERLIGDDVARIRMIDLLSNHASAIPKLRQRTLFDLSRQIDALFKPSDAASLKKILYPERTPSIAFQLIAIPFMYLVNLGRVFFSILLSLAALILGNPHPLKPIIHAGTVFFDKLKKDLSRLLVFASYVTYLAHKAVSCLIKMLAFTLNMAVGRLGSVFNVHTGHLFHEGVASVHVFFRSVGEFFYPARATKSVVFAHPSHTLNEIKESSYQKIGQSLQGDPVKDEPKSPDYFPAIFSPVGRENPSDRPYINASFSING